MRNNTFFAVSGDAKTAGRFSLFVPLRNSTAEPCGLAVLLTSLIIT
jgi:hypothetical protein